MGGCISCGRVQDVLRIEQKTHEEFEADRRKGIYLSWGKADAVIKERIDRFVQKTEVPLHASIHPVWDTRIKRPCLIVIKTPSSNEPIPSKVPIVA